MLLLNTKRSEDPINNEAVGMEGNVDKNGNFDKNGNRDLRQNLKDELMTELNKAISSTFLSKRAGQALGDIIIRKTLSHATKYNS